MQHNLVKLCKITAHQLGGRPGHELMRCAVEPIAFDPILPSKIAGDGVRRRIGRQGAEEGRIEDRHVGHIKLSPRRLNAEHRTRIVQRSKRNQIPDLLKHLVINDGRISKVWPAVHDSVADRTNSDGIKINAIGSKIFCHRLHGGGMISDRTTRLADSLNEALGLHLCRLRHHELILQRRGTSIQHQDGRLTHVGTVAAASVDCCRLMACAWTAVIATVLTMSSTNAPRERSLTGFFNPCSTGPMAMAWALRCTAL